MSSQDDPMEQARSNAQSMAAQAEEATSSIESSDVQSHLHEAIRFGEHARWLLDEALDASDSQDVIVHGEQALEAVEQALDQANQALLSSDEAMRDHIAQLSAQTELSIMQMEMALGSVGA